MDAVNIHIAEELAIVRSLTLGVVVDFSDDIVWNTGDTGDLVNIVFCEPHSLWTTKPTERSTSRCIRSAYSSLDSQIGNIVARVKG